MSDYISEDNLILIFKYLPVKTLLRFRCVCNCWKQLIDHSPTLIQQHLSVQKPRFIVDSHLHDPHLSSSYLVVDATLPRSLVNTLSKPIVGKLYVLFGTLHGVVCLCDYRSLVLWNPSLRKFRSLPLPSDFEWYIGKRMQNCYGFWIDPSTKEFKAIVLQRKPAVKCILYSSIRRGWTVIPTKKLAKWRSCKEGPPVMIGGVAHWGGCLDESIDDSYHLDHEHKDKVILSFDFVQESFEIIGMPNLYNRHSAPCHWQGTLSLVCWDVGDDAWGVWDDDLDVGDDEFPRGCEIYSRQEGSWVKMVDFEVYEPIEHAFWAVEDAEGRKKTGKKKRGIEEEGLGDLIGDSQPSVRILAMIIDVSYTLTGELMLHGTETGRQTVRNDLFPFENVTVAYDFVESLLFP